MCQSNLLPNIYSHTEQDSCCSPKHWASWLTKGQKKEKKEKSHLEGNLKQMHRKQENPPVIVWKPLSGYELTTHWLYWTQVSSVTDLERYCRDAPQVVFNADAGSARLVYSQRLNHCSREMRSNLALGMPGSCLTMYLTFDMCSALTWVPTALHLSPL